MKREIRYVLAASLYLLIYHIFFLLGFERWVSLLFAISPLVVFWLVWRVLHVERDSDKTWEEGFRYDFE